MGPTGPVGRFAFAVLAALAVASVAGEAKAPELDPDFPPCVVKTVPENRAKDVDPALREIKVTFDRPMMTEKQWSWIIHQQFGVYPGDREGPQPRWENGGRTCVLAVKLVPNTLYAVGVNSFRHTGFRAPDNKVAVPHTWVFKTGKAKKPPEF